MKKILAAALLLLTFSACTKKDNAESSGKAKFVINGIQSVDLTNNTSASSEFAITVVGDPETVALSAEDLPPGLHVSFDPSSGTPPFNSKVRVWNDFSGNGGTQGFHITGRTETGTRNYLLNATFAAFRGWKFGEGVYLQKSVARIPGSSTDYPQIKIYGGGAGILTLSFAQGGKLPTSNKTYKISNTALGPDEVRITMTDGPIIFSAVGDNNASATFMFDNQGQFVLKCKNVEMRNGVDQKILECNVYE